MKGEVAAEEGAGEGEGEGGSIYLGGPSSPPSAAALPIYVTVDAWRGRSCVRILRGSHLIIQANPLPSSPWHAQRELHFRSKARTKVPSSGIRTDGKKRKEKIQPRGWIRSIRRGSLVSV